MNELPRPGIPPSIDGIVSRPSPFSVEQTLGRLQAAIHSHNLVLFAHIDHSGEARRIGLTMQEAHVLIFGNPKGGTPLMIASPLLALDLPLKALVWQSEDGRVWVSSTSSDYLRDRYAIPQDRRFDTMSNDHQRSVNDPVPGVRRKAVPIAMAAGPAEYTAGQQELPVMLTSLADMVQWAQNWARSRSIWPLGYGLACCAIELIATASAPQYDLSRFGSEVFRSSPRQADLMVVAGTVSVKMGPRLRLLWQQMPEPKWVMSMGQCANSGGEFYDSYYTVQGVDTIVPVDVYVPGCPPRPEAVIEGILKLREKIEKQGLRLRGNE